MPANDRLRRRVAPDGSRSPEEVPARRPEPIEAALALQRSAGNQAVIARLMHNQADNKLSVPRSYADLRIGWDEAKKYVVRSTAANNDPKLGDLVKTSQTVKQHAVDGVGVDFGEMVGEADVGAKAAGFVGEYAEEGTAEEVAAVAEDPYRVLKVFKGQPLFSTEELQIAWAQAPSDYLPGAPDLPAKGKSVRSAIPKDPNSKTYWQYMCVLIALVKAEGLASVNRITKAKGPAPSTLDAAVQKLHDHYMGLKQPIQYDDSSARAKVMTEWGYTRIYAGLTSWADLPKKIALPAGTYIFDITGHTVLVEVKQEVKRGEDPLADPTAVFVPKSEPDNYEVGKEFTKPVTGIYKK
jgi:hypothetical protein